MYCPNCGASVTDGSAFCEACGKPTNATTAAPGQPNTSQSYQQYQPPYPLAEQKSKLVAGLLQIFLGGLGIGRFYLGYTTIGVLQIVATWLTCGVGAIWPLIDGIMIITGTPNVDANGNPLKD